MPKQPKQLRDLFHHTLQDLYFAEKKIASTLPKLAKAAQSEDLTAAFEKHRDETLGQIKRLEEVFAVIDEKARGKTCPAINGLAEEGAEVIEEFKGSPALDIGLVGAARSVEHYEMARYLGLIDMAKQLGLNEAASLLQESFQEEEATDSALEKLAATLTGDSAISEAA